MSAPARPISTLNICDRAEPFPGFAGAGGGVGFGVWASMGKLKQARMMLICKTDNTCPGLARMTPSPILHPCCNGNCASVWSLLAAAQSFLQGNCFNRLCGEFAAIHQGNC